MPYPIWWDSLITVYNKFEDKQTHIVTWHRTVLTNCFWKYTRQKVTIGNTVLETSNIRCRIPMNPKFMERHSWEQVPNDKMSEYFTLSEGDIIVKGEVDDEINEYEKGHRATDFIAKYKTMQGCMVVETVSINTMTGTNDKHYLVEGN